MSRKSEVYTWRVSPQVKASLEEAARNANRSMAGLLDEIVAERLQASELVGEAEQDRQRQLHARAARFAGRLTGTNPRRAETARVSVRARLGERRKRER